MHDHSRLIIKPITNKYSKMNSNKSLLGICLILFSFTIFHWSCTDSTEIVERNYRLTWEDNFEGTAGTLPNPANWVYELGRGPNGDGWGNNELQSYTNNPENVSLDGQGNLAITARNEGGFSSARIKTEGKFDQAYGRFEARIKLPYGQGIWPAFWMLGADFSTVGWPQCGEIDIMEYRGQEPNLVHGTVHGPGYSKINPITKTFGFEDLRLDLDFHTYAIEWDENSIDFFVDDFQYLRIKPEDATGEWVFDHPFFIILNVAIGGNFVGLPNVPGIFPQTMLVDYVRVYEEVDE